MIMNPRIGNIYNDYCYHCHKKTQHKLISYNKFNNPVYECMSCRSFSVDRINEEDEM